MDEALFRSLEWRCIGPHRGGRVVAVAGDPTDPATFYFGACAGGVWKTTSGGALWENVSDGFFGTSAIGALAVAESAPNVVYAGTGEATIRGNVSHGDGVYRSSDGGHSWQHVGLDDTRHIGDLVIHPTNPDVAYVAALGHAWGPNAERGVFRTRDGGKTWEKVLYKSERAGAVSLAMDPHHPDTLYATIWQTQRMPYTLWSGGEESGLWRSTDGGDTWTDLSRHKGLPQDGVYGKIGVAASPAQPGRVWALIEASDVQGEDAGGLYRSDDWGETWEKQTDKPELRKRPWYYMHIYADPQHADTVWVLDLAVWKSTDGGKTFVEVPDPHGDNHDLWIDPHDSRRMIEGNDGGACVTYDGGRTWSSILNQPTAQFYHVTADDEVPYNVYGSQQDNWAMRLPSLDFEGAISWKDYVEPGGGESGYIAISKKPPHKVFGGGTGTGNGHGRLIAWDPRTDQKRNVTLWPEVHGSGVGAEEHRYRFQWTFPVEFSPHDPDALYICSNHVHVSRDEGSSWEAISPDLTRNDPEKLRASGGPITADNSGAEIYCTIFAFRESPHEAGVFWAGSDDGLIHLSRDGGATWQNVTPPGLPEWSLVSIVEPSPHASAPGTAYVAATAYKLDDRRPYLFKTDDYGASWSAIAEGLPEEAITRVIREDPSRRGLLYAGTETGVFISFDDGAHWQPFQGNLPVTPIHDLMVKGTDLLAATHGRSFWILDDLSPLHQMQADQDSAPATLYAPRETVRFRVYDRSGMSSSNPPGYANYQLTGPVTVAYRDTVKADGTKTKRYFDAGQNPPIGVIIHYAFAQKPEDEVTLAILDAEGNEVRSYSSKGENGKPNGKRVPAEAGANRFVWDFRGRAPTALEDDPKKDDPSAQAQEAGIAPRMLPGDYQVRLTVGDTVLTQPFTLAPDPRLPVTAEELREQYTLKAAIRDRVDTVNMAINTIRRLRKQLADWEQRAQRNQSQGQAGEQANQAGEVADAAKQLGEKLAALEAELINPGPDKPRPGAFRLKEKLAALSAMIDESDDTPTQGAREVYANLAEQVDERRQQLDALLAEEVAAFNGRVQAAGLPAVGE
ncbi:MAG TPA: hypothetical protein VF116_04575 [Ktedonobacterales bacterium]